jgi:hypothetical protein
VSKPPLIINKAAFLLKTEGAIKSPYLQTIVSPYMTNTLSNTNTITNANANTSTLPSTMQVAPMNYTTALLGSLNPMNSMNTSDMYGNLSDMAMTSSTGMMMGELGQQPGPPGTRLAGYIGAYSPEQRKLRIEKFLEKRSRRVWTRKVKYDVRKNFADSRLRIKVSFDYQLSWHRTDIISYENRDAL